MMVVVLAAGTLARVLVKEDDEVAECAAAQQGVPAMDGDGADEDRIYFIFFSPAFCWYYLPT
jgi:hypothetical protein